MEGAEPHPWLVYEFITPHNPPWIFLRKASAKYPELFFQDIFQIFEDRCIGMFMVCDGKVLADIAAEWGGYS